MKKKYRPLNLLPFYFRNIGLGLLGLLFVSVFVKLMGWSDFEFLPHYKQLFEIVLLLSLSVIALSKGRIEDELTLEIRTRLFAMAFLCGAGIVLFSKIFNFFEIWEMEEMGASQLVLSMFLFYFIVSWFVKKRM